MFWGDSKVASRVETRSLWGRPMWSFERSGGAQDEISEEQDCNNCLLEAIVCTEYKCNMNCTEYSRKVGPIEATKTERAESGSLSQALDRR